MKSNDKNNIEHKCHTVNKNTDTTIDLTKSRTARLADFCYEAGFLRHIPRSGFPFLGTGKQNVAEHSYRVTVIGWILAKIAGVDHSKVMQLCIFHDFHEARTGDFNYVNHRYNTCRAHDAMFDAVQGTGVENEILEFFKEFEQKTSIESRLANDADQIDLILELAVELSKGNRFAREWLDSALKRLQTDQGRYLADAILRKDPNNWWYGQVEKEWWIHHCDQPERS